MRVGLAGCHTGPYGPALPRTPPLVCTSKDGQQVAVDDKGRGSTCSVQSPTAGRGADALVLGCGGSGLPSRAREAGSALPGDGVGPNLSEEARQCGTFLLSHSYSAVLTSTLQA